MIEVGRIASWASCAPFDLAAYARAFGGRYSLPYLPATYLRVSAIALPLTTGESVRI